MIAGIIGDVIGSVYEAYQWQNKNLALIQPLPLTNNKDIKTKFNNTKWVRKQYGWTDDSLCTLALYHAYIHQKDPTKVLQDFCKRYMSNDIGFGKSFQAWIDNPIPYESFGNGSIMRIGFIPYLDISLEEQQQLGKKYTEISHNHPDSFQAVEGFINIANELKNNNKDILNIFLDQHQFNKNIEQMHQEFIFEMNALQTLLQAIVIIKESSSIEEVLINCFYVGGDCDTLACITLNLAAMIYEIPMELWSFSKEKFESYPELKLLIEHFETHQKN